nr:putative reverse transcriptase domain-containing protein [Tanacetum cinerariifolium]
MGESSHDSTPEQHGKQIEEILNHLDELPLDLIERIEDVVEGLVQRMLPKRSSTSEASTMSQASIKKLVADSVSTALETQTATMAEADNSIREIPIVKRGNYKEFISCQPFYFNENKVAFATGTLTNDALSWWNAYAQPIGIEQANRITWTELKRLLTNKYYPRTEIKKMEDEFYNLSVKGNDLKTYVKRFQELAVLCPNMVPNNEKLMEVFIGGLPRSIEGNVTTSKPQTLEEAINIAQRKEKLYAKFSKCDLWIRTMQFLGHLIDSQGLHVDPAKVEAVKNWASPTTPTEIRQFLGLVGYFHGFIKDFSKIEKSLTILSQKNKKFAWGKDQEMDFQILKQKLCEAPILALPEGNDDFIVYCDASIQGQEIIHETIEKIVQIRQHLQAARDQQRSYANVRQKPLEFQTGDRVMLKISPRKGIIRFEKRGKLNPQYIRPFKILNRIGPVAYKFKLPEELSKVHNIFHVSNLKKCISEKSLIIPMKELKLDDKLNFVEEPVEIMDQEIKQLRQSHIPIIKVRWNSKRGPKYMWEREDEIHAKYPHSFPNNSLSSS